MTILDGVDDDPPIRSVNRQRDLPGVMPTCRGGHIQAADPRPRWYSTPICHQPSHGLDWVTVDNNSQGFGLKTAETVGMSRAVILRVRNITASISLQG